MADNLEKNSLDNTGSSKSRSLIIIAIALILIIAFVGYLVFKKPIRKMIAAEGMELSKAPSISSAPLTGTPSREYVKLQEQQNVGQAQKALKEKKAAISTPTRATYLGELGQLPTGEDQPGCSVEELRQAKAAGVSASELACRGCSATALKAAGYTAGELRNAGFTAAQLKEAGFSAEDLKNAGFSAEDLKNAGFSAQELKDAGFSAAELLAAGFDKKALKDAGFSDEDLAKLPQNCDPEYLKKAHANGISAADLKGCGAAALKTAGYTAKELKDAGFSAGELRRAGFSAKNLKDAGFSAKDLKDAGFSAKELKDAGFSEKELRAAGFTDGDLARAGIVSKNCSFEALRQANANGVSASELKECGAAALKAAGYTAKDLKDAGFSAKDLKDAGFSAKDLKDAGFSAKDLKDAGFSAKDLKDAGFSAKDLKDAGFSAKDLKDAGFSAKDLKDAGFSNEELQKAGFSAQEIANAGVSPSEKNKASSLVSLAPTPGNEGMSDELARIREQQAGQLTKQERDDKVKELQQNMLTQSADMFSSWVPLPRQQYAESAPEATGSQVAASVTSKAEGATVVGGDTSKAGTIFYAVLDTAINSDEPGPILATIVQGKYKGAKVLGKFTRVEKKVILQFTTMNAPSLNRSIAINAYAIDPNTARTSLASDVDSHYLLRYGMLFASSFVSGLGDAVSNAGTTITLTDGTIETVSEKLDTKEQFLSALGEVGTSFGSATSGFFDMPPTIKVNAGSTLGLLLMNDLIVPKT